jgi:putative transposase
MFAEGISQHVVQRGNNRSPMFADSDDLTVFMITVRDACRRNDVRVHAFVLMTTHFHLLVTPATPVSLPRMMQHVGRRYVPYFNARHRRTGGLWEGRYRSHLVQTETHWFLCLRYIELNPVRAGMVATPDGYRWSSYATHAHGKPNPLLEPHALYLGLGNTPSARQAAYRTLCRVPMTEAELAAIRYAVQTRVVDADGAARPLVSTT